jgi:glycosyltransferase involved in cell wall biosynthesis
MIILHTLPEFYYGGIETSLIDMCRFLLRSNHRVILVSNGGVLYQELESLGVTHYQLAVKKKSISGILRTIPKLAEIIQKEKVDVVHAHSRVPAWIAYFAAKKTGTVFITTWHGHYGSWLWTLPMCWGKRMIAVSSSIAKHMAVRYGINPEKCRLIPVGLDLDKYKPRFASRSNGCLRRVGLIGRMTRIKGHMDFLKAMAEVIKIVPDIRILIVGDAAPKDIRYKKDVLEMIKCLGLESYTDLMGNRYNIPEIISGLDLLVLASTAPEAFGRVIIEAQSCKVPVVATRVGGVQDIIEDEKNGLLVSPGDIQSMSQAVLRILQDSLFAKTLIENAYRIVKERYDIGLIVRATLGVYEDAIK